MAGLITRQGRGVLRCGALAVCCLALAVTVGCQPAESPKGKEKGADAKAKSDGGGEAQPVKKSAKPKTGYDVLKAMVEAYKKATSYSDKGTAHMLAEADGKKILENNEPFSVVFARPNKLHVTAYRTEMVCDGDKLYAYMRNIPGQILNRAAPEKWTLGNIHPDYIIREDMRARGFAGAVPPQIPLLLADNAMDMLLRDMGEPELIEPGEINGHDCYRVRLNSSMGPATFWVDKETFVLRRMVLPTDGLRAAMSQDGPISNLSIVADFTGAELNGNIPSKAFEFEVPQDARLVEFLVPPVLSQWLNKKTPEFKVTDLAGKTVTSESLAGKTAVVLFWSVRLEACRQALKGFHDVYQKLKNNPRVAFLTVCVDPAQQFGDAEMKKALADLQVDVPLYRDAEMAAVAALSLGEPPATLIINDKGILQHCEGGNNPKYAELLQTRIEKCVAGEDISADAVGQYKEFVDGLRGFAKSVETGAMEPAQGDGAGTREVRLPEVKTAPPSEPTTFKLVPSWKVDAIKQPGNIVVVQGKAGPERLLVIDNSTTIAEVGLDGKVIANHELSLEKGEFVNVLRTAVGGDGRRYYAAYALGQQRCHVLDENWRVVSHYPKDALSNPHSGIGDVRLADLDGDGRLELYVGYYGVVGVQCASLEGNRLWANRSDVANAACLAVGGADAKGRRELFCTNSLGSVTALNGAGERVGEVKVRNRLFNWIAGADLRGNGELCWCGLTAMKPSDNIVVGFSLNGDEQWNYTLPAGIHPQPIEPIIAGRMMRDNPGQWLLPGPDGSIHIFSADGKLIDKFNYGAVLQGLAGLEINGRPALIIASAKGLRAYRLE